MEMRLSSEHLPFPRNLSLQQKAKHSLAKQFWGEFVLKANIDDDKHPKYFGRKVAPHKKAVLDNVLRAFSTYLPGKLVNEMLHAVIDLQEGYRKAHYWEEKHACSLPFTILNPLAAGSYAAEYFISPGGHFDDLSWAKKFVSDENQCIQKRFQLACFYCFEDQILHLWHTMKTNGQLLCNGNLDEISELAPLVAVWVCEIENKIDEYISDYVDSDEDNDGFINKFICSGFNAAAYTFHKDATYFFWTRSSDTEKRFILKRIDNLFIALAGPGNRNDAEFIYFIFSFIFPVEKKNSLIVSSMQTSVQFGIDLETSVIWSCLLRSQFWETTLKDILTFPYPIPSIIYFKIVYCLICDLISHEIPVHKAIVRILWNKFCHLQENVVHKSIIFIEELKYMNAIDLLEVIIEPLRDSEKVKLLEVYQPVAIKPIVHFSIAENYDAVLRYLLAFLIDRSQVDQKLIVDASEVLDLMEKILKCHMNELSKREENEVKNVVDCVQGSLQVLNHLLEKVENDSTRKTTSY